jgi:hypothetical protein
MAGNQVIRDWAEEAPRRGHATVDGFSKRLDAELAKMDTLLSFFGAKRWAKQRWACWMEKQRAMNVLVKRIRGNVPATVVAFRDGRFNPHIRGHPPTTVMGQRRALARASCRVFEVNEHMTSRVRVNFLSIFSGVFDKSLRSVLTPNLWLTLKTWFTPKTGLTLTQFGLPVNFKVVVNSKNGVNSGNGVNFDNTCPTHNTLLTLNGMVNPKNGVNSNNVVDYEDMVNIKRYPR